MSYGILFLRVIVGFTIAAHGAQKLFGAFGGQGLHGTGEGFRALRFRQPLAMVLLAGTAEFGGGLLLASGLLTPFAALAIAIVMLTSIGAVHWRNGFWSTNGGYEYNLVIWATAVAIAATGPGRFSFDRLIGWDDNLSGLWWGVGVLGVSAVVAAATLELGRVSARPAAAPTTPGTAVDVPVGNGSEGPRSPVEIQVTDASEGNDLVGFLRRQGLPADLFEAAGLWNVEVGSPREDPPLLVSDLFDALQSWVPRGGGTGVLIQYGERRSYAARRGPPRRGL
jgi:putative oxidoreductase